MTVIVGIKCQDGIVIGTDSSATFAVPFGQGQLPIIEQSTKKIEIIDNKIILAGTGAVGLGQRFQYQIEHGHKEKEFRGLDAIPMARKMSQMALDDFASTGVNPGAYGALVAFQAADHKLHLCEFGLADFQPEMKTDGIWYVSMGSGELIADPFLGFMREVFWSTGKPTLAEGIFAVTWTLRHVFKVNAGGVNGPHQLATIQRENDVPLARIVSEDELSGHLENVEGDYEHLRDYQRLMAGTLGVEVPDVPKPKL
jgi:20S proteasome alpha/beta subunit